jgi:hypothetical protein
MSEQGPDQNLRASARRILRASRGRAERGPIPEQRRSRRWRLEFAIAVLIAVALVALILGLQTRLIG